MVPVLGDFADFFFKANDRNYKLFEAYLYERAAAAAAEKEVVTQQANVQIPPPPPVRGHSGAGAGPSVPVNQSFNAKNTAPKSSKSVFGRNHQHEDKSVYQAQPYENQTVLEMGSV